MQSHNKIKQNTVSFGWYYPMHSTILKKSVTNTSINEASRNILLNAVQRPDLEEFFLFGQKHFYYPKDKIKSYLDYTGTHNAKYMYKVHLKKALESFRANNSIAGIEESGRALHYLQDMTQPHHITSGSIIRKAREAVMPHHKFEMDIFTKQDKFCDNYTPVQINAKSFNSLFEETVKLSEKNKVPNKDNVKNWDNIAQNSINLAISTTNKFFEMISNYI